MRVFQVFRWVGMAAAVWLTFAQAWAVCTVGSKTLTITPSTIYYPFAGGAPSVTLTYNVTYTNINSGGAGADCTVNLNVPVTRVNVGGTFSAASCNIPINIPNPSTGINRSGSCNLTWTAPASPAAIYSHDASSNPAGTAFDITAALVANAPVYRRPRITIANNTNGAEAGPTAGALTVTQSNIIPEATTVDLSYAGTATTGSDYSGPLSVTIPANSLSAPIALNITDDPIVEDDETAIVTLTAVTAGSGTIATPSSATNTIADNDTATVTITNNSDGTEPGPVDGQMTVTLSNPVATDTNISYTVAGTATSDGDYVALPGSLTIPALATTAMIPIPVIDDFIDDDAETVIVTLSGTSNPKVTLGATTEATNTIEDDDTASVAVTGGPITVDEFGSTETIFVALTSEPTSDVTITVTGLDSSEHAVSSTTLTFTPLDWDLEQPIDISGVNDFIQDGDVTVTLSLVPTGGGYTGVDPGTVDVTTIDDDEAGISVSGDPVNVSETGTTGVLDVVLLSEPTADVLVTLTASDPSEATLAPATLTFTPANWNISQQATITGVDDALLDGEIESSIEITVSSADPNFDGLSVPPAMVFTADNDSAGFSVTGGPFTLTESGSQRTFSVVLLSAPLSNVVLSATATDTTEVSLSPASLTFTPANWNIPQLVTISGVDDSTVDGNIASSVAVAVVASASDDSFDALPSQSVQVTTLDNDVAQNDEQVRRAFESQTHNYLASRMRTLSANRPQIFRMVRRNESGFLFEGDSQSLKGDFALNNAALERIANVTVTPTADFSPPTPTQDINAWIEGRFAIYGDDRNNNTQGDFFVGYTGIDMRVADNMAIGLMAQLDWTEETSTVGRVDGTGWMIGPYLTAQPAPNLFLDARALWGKSNNRAEQEISGVGFEGDFTSERVLLEARVSGAFSSHNTTLRPDMTLFWMKEAQGDYTVSNGARTIAVNGLSASLGQLSAGLNVSHSIAQGEVSIAPFVEPRLTWTFDNPGRLGLDGVLSAQDDASGSVAIGINILGPTTEFSIDAAYEATFNGDADSWSGGLQFLHRF